MDSSELAPDCPNVAAALADGGYTTAAISTVGNPLLRQGFATFEAPFGSFPEGVRSASANLDRITFEKAADWVRAHKDSRFFLLVHTFEVHDYFLSKDYARKAAQRVQPGYRGRFLSWALREPSIDIGRQLFLDLAAADEADMAFVRQLYREDVRATDAAIGGLLDHLEQLGLKDKTLVVLTADHGEGFDRESRRFSHGGRLHDDLLHVPLVVSWPGHIAPALSSHPVELVDVAPTLLTLAAVPSPRLPHGRALLGRRADWQIRLGRDAWDLLFSPGRREGWAEECCFAVDANGLRTARRAPQYAILVAPYKFIQAEHSAELHDVEADPDEERNLVADEVLVRERLAGRLRQRVAAFGVAAEGSETERQELLRSLGYVR